MSSDIGSVVIPPVGLPGTATTVSAVGTSLFSLKNLIPILFIGGGIALITLRATSTVSDSLGYFEGGGITMLIAGVAWLSYNTGLGSSIYNRLQGIRGGTVLTVIFVLVVVILAFVLLFYNFSPAESLPFASIVLISLTIIGVVGMLYIYSGKQPLATTISRFVFSLYFFLPYALFTFGILTDILLQRIEYFPASFTGLAGVLLNFAVSLMVNNGVVPPVQNDLCEIPGLSPFTSSLVPQSMMFTLSTIAYIATYISRSNIGGVSGFVVSDVNYRVPAWVLYFSLYAIHLFVLGRNGCLTQSKAIAGLLVPLGFGGAMGAIGFSVLERSGTGKNEYSGNAGQQPILGGATKPSTAPTCSAVGNGDEFVCETFKNGKLETTVMTE